MNREDRNTKQVVSLALIGTAAVLLVGVVLVGLISGNWPWSNNAAGNGDTDQPGYSTQGEALPEDTTQGGEDEQDITVEIIIDSSTEAGSNSGNSGNSGNNADISFDELTGATTETKPNTSTTKPTESATKPNQNSGDVEIDIPLD